MTAVWDKQERKIPGCQSGGLKPIFVDPTIDPAPGLCFVASSQNTASASVYLVSGSVFASIVAAGIVT